MLEEQQNLDETRIDHDSDFPENGSEFKEIVFTHKKEGQIASIVFVNLENHLYETWIYGDEEGFNHLRKARRYLERKGFEFDHIVWF